MNRREAIDALAGAWTQRDSEFCVGVQEHEQSRRELEEALGVFGVTPEELWWEPDE